MYPGASRWGEERDSMSGSFAVGLLCGIYAGLANGVFLLPMRYTRKWAWENTWLVFTVLATGAIPCVFAFIAIPNLFSLIRHSPLSFFLPGLIAGTLWGIALVGYGLGIGILGVAVGSAVISTTATIAGVLGPIVAYAPGRLVSSGNLTLLLALALIVAGIYEFARAVARKERELVGKDVVKQVVRGNLRTGLVICLVTGVLGTAFIYGGKSSTALVDAAKATGAAPTFAFYIAYMVTFNAGMIPGVIYSLYKLRVNNTAECFRVRGCLLWNLGIVLAMSLLWYSGILMYGIGSEKMGRLGPSMAYVLFAGGTILFATLFGWLAGEWKGSSRRTIRDLLIGMCLLVSAIVLVAFGIPSLP
jgi:L-rhamnose-H+ transport protein